MPPLQWRDAAVAAWRVKRVKRHERRRPLEDWIQRPMRWEAFQCVSENCLRINGDKYTIKDLDLTWFDHQRQECPGDFGVCYVVNLHISWYKLVMYHIYRPESSKGEKNLPDLDSCPFEGFLHVWGKTARICTFGFACPAHRRYALAEMAVCARLTVRFLRPFCARVWHICLLIVKRMLFWFFCTRQTVSAQRGTNHQKVYNEHLYPKFWVRTKVQVYIYMYIIPSYMLVMRVRVLVCLLCRPILGCSEYTMAFFFFLHFLFSSLALWLLWVCGFCGFTCTMLCLSIFLSI